MFGHHNNDKKDNKIESNKTPYGKNIPEPSSDLTPKEKEVYYKFAKDPFAPIILQTIINNPTIARVIYEMGKELSEGKKITYDSDKN